MGALEIDSPKSDSHSAIVACLPTSQKLWTVLSSKDNPTIPQCRGRSLFDRIHMTRWTLTAARGLQGSTTVLAWDTYASDASPGHRSGTFIPTWTKTRSRRSPKSSIRPSKSHALEMWYKPLRPRIWCSRAAGKEGKEDSKVYRQGKEEGHLPVTLYRLPVIAGAGFEPATFGL